MFLFLIFLFSVSLQAEVVDTVSFEYSEGNMFHLDTLCLKYLSSSPTKSIEYGKQAIQIARKINNSEIENSLARKIGYAYYQIGNYNDCIDYYQISLNYSLKKENYFDVAKMLNLIGDLHNNKGNYNKAMQNFIQSESICDSLFNTETDSMHILHFRSILYTNIGLLHAAIDSTNKAFDYFNKVLETAKMISDSIRLAAAYSNIGMTYVAQSNFDSAFANYSKSLAISKAINHNRYIASTTNNIASLYLDTEQYDSAMHYFLQVKEISEATNNKLNSIIVYRNIGDTYVKTGNFTDALHFLIKALEISKEIGSKRQTYMNYKALSDYYKEINSFEKTYKYYKLYTDLKDSVKGEDARTKIAELEIQYQSEKKHNENLILRKNREFDKLKITKKNSLITILSIGIVFVLLLLIVVFFLYRDRYLAYRKLVKKNIEIIDVENKLDTTRKLLNNLNKENEIDSVKSEPDDMLKVVSVRLEELMKTEKPYFSNSITVDEISSKIATNRTYLSNSIKQEFGKSFNGYVNEYRIKEAMRLLLSPDYENHTIEGIGHTVGFNNRISFNTNFKKFAGVSPSIFRMNN